MGCSATRNLPIEPLDDYDDLPNGNGEARVIPVSARPANNIPPIEPEDIPAELLESGAVSNVQKGPNGLSFEIVLDEENGNDSSGNKQPPKRLQRLEEQPTSPITLNKLQEKLDEAEVRRQQIIAQRIQSAKVRNQLRKQSSDGSNRADDDPRFLRVPPDNPPQTPNTYDVSYM